MNWNAELPAQPIGSPVIQETAIDVQTIWRQRQKVAWVVIPHSNSDVLSYEKARNTDSPSIEPVFYRHQIDGQPADRP